MTLEIALTLGILVAALVLFVTDWLRMDLVALLVLSSLALLGLVSPADAVSGFSNPAVITVWAMFIISEGLTRTGIAEQIGRQVTRVAGRSELRMITIFMLVAGVMSAFMNNIGVAALLLPVAMEVARRGGVAPSRVLMPLAYGTLVGGMMTLIGTPPNLLVSNALREARGEGFGFFDFAWIGVPILLTVTAFMALVGRHMLTRTDTTQSSASQHELRTLYGLQERIVALRVPDDALLSGRTLADSALASAAGLMVIALTRDDRTEALPSGKTVLRGGDVLLAQGRLDRFDLLRRWSSLSIEREAPTLHERLWAQAALAELVLTENSPLVGQPLRHLEFREQHAANVLALRHGGSVHRTHLAEQRLTAGDRLLVQCSAEALAALHKVPGFDVMAPVSEGERREVWRLDERLFVLRVPQDSALAGSTLGENRIGDAFDFRLLGVFRSGALLDTAASEDLVEAGDLLLVQGREEDLDVLRGLQQMEMLEDATPYLRVFDEGQLEMVEATLHPHVRIDGKTVASLELGERYQVAVAAVWRNGKALRSGVGALTLQRGDALLVVGPRERLAALGADEDLIVLNPIQVQPIDTSKAPLAGGLMALTIGTVLAGWLHISIAAVAGATLMVLTRCLSMEQAYRAIDWRSIFLIAGMLPLGIAMHSSGAAEFLAGGVIAVLGPYGPWPVIAGLYACTALATLIMPNAALVLLMAPIALSAAADLGISPIAPVMAIAIAAAASFASPVAHPANVLVMGPGGYRFVDYVKLGLPLTLLVFAVAMLLLPVVWPL
ncbi:MAG: SLC13 family permease [Pseudomonadota bacterium]